MGKMLFTAIAISAVLGANAPMAGAESAKAKPKAAKHVHSEKEHTCDKCKKAEKDCKCDEKAKHDVTIMKKAITTTKMRKSPNHLICCGTCEASRC